jgi:hypothetical protein
LEHFKIHVGTMELRDLDKLIKEKEREKKNMKQELLRRKHTNDINLENKIRKEINNHTLDILLEKAKDSENPEVIQLYGKLKAMRQVNNEN